MELSLSSICCWTRGSSTVCNFFSNLRATISFASSNLLKISVGTVGDAFMSFKSASNLVSSDAACSTYSFNFSARTTGGSSFTRTSNFSMVFFRANSMAPFTFSGTTLCMVFSTSKFFKSLNSDPDCRSITLVIRTPIFCGESSTATNMSVKPVMVSAFASSTVVNTPSSRRPTAVPVTVASSFVWSAAFAITSSTFWCFNCLSATSFNSRSIVSGCPAFAALSALAVSFTSSTLSLKSSMAPRIIPGSTFPIPFNSINCLHSESCWLACCNLSSASRTGSNVNASCTPRPNRLKKWNGLSGNTVAGTVPKSSCVMVSSRVTSARIAGAGAAAASGAGATVCAETGTTAVRKKKVAMMMLLANNNLPYRVVHNARVSAKDPVCIILHLPTSWERWMNKNNKYDETSAGG